jgi:anti-sigma regulatory factor (Ser/Thr protein kinase)
LRLQPDLFVPSLGFNHADGLIRAYSRGTAPNVGTSGFRLETIGPLAELYQFDPERIAGSASDLAWLDLGGQTDFIVALRAGRTRWLSNDGAFGYLSGAKLACESTLQHFKTEPHLAALKANMPSATAGQIGAAFGELIGNIIDHSAAIPSGIAAFRAKPSAFEFVVSDRGIGPLASLTSCAEYASMSDHGEALQAIIETGVSRFGAGTGHGNGFKPIFEKLADMSGQLRFRSGDAALTLDGRFGDKVKLQVAQKPPIAGFFASVLVAV